MRITVGISTPKHVHIWKHAVPLLRGRGHDVQVLLRDYRETLPVATGVGLQGEVFGRCRGGSFRRMAEYPAHVWGQYRLARRFKPDIVTGYGTYESHTARLLGKPALAWNDTEHAPGQNFLIRTLATHVLVPSGFQGDVFGKKQVPFPSYLELAYLHPNRFKPDPAILEDVGLCKGDRFALIRFNALDATHDVSAAGYNAEQRRELVHRLLKHGKVLISAEADVTPDLEPYVLRSHFDRIHDILAHASLYVGDSGTMQNEAALLGVPSVRYTNLPKEKDRGNSRELEERYGLIENVRDIPASIARAEALFADRTSLTDWRRRRDAMLGDLVDLTQFIVETIEGYPESVDKLKSQVAGRASATAEGGAAA